jgi:glycosyltransferase involved in cell wall biosynthesis
MSVIIPVCDHESHVHDAIKSVLAQSFTNFEIIVAGYGAADNTLSIVRSFDDRRIHIISGNDFHDRISALNKGLETASGKYIAIMQANHIMHVNRLKVQHAFMEAEPSIDACSCCTKQLGNQKSMETSQNPSSVPGSGGLIENPLLNFLQGNCIIYSSAMIRKMFLEKHQLQYENYPDAEDFKFWTEMAKHGGQFYVDTQQLQYYFATDKRKNGQKQQSIEKITHEIVVFLTEINGKNYPELPVILENFKMLQEKEMITQQDINRFFHHFFTVNKDQLSMRI